MDHCFTPILSHHTKLIKIKMFCKCILELNTECVGNQPIPLVYFSKTNNHDVISKCDTNGGTWLQIMCPHTFLKNSKPLAKVIGTKQYRKSSRTIFEGPLNEKHSEHARVQINASWFKVTFVFGWKSSIKKGRLTSTNGCKKQKATMVSLNGTTKMFGNNACTTRTYFLTCVNAHVQHNHGCSHNPTNQKGCRTTNKNIQNLINIYVLPFKAMAIMEINVFPFIWMLKIQTKNPFDEILSFD